MRGKWTCYFFETVSNCLNNRQQQLPQDVCFVKRCVRAKIEETLKDQQAEELVVRLWKNCVTLIFISAFYSLQIVSLFALDAVVGRPPLFCFQPFNFTSDVFCCVFSKSNDRSIETKGVC